MSATARYLKDHVYFRCGQAVSRLCEAGLLARPELASSETEIGEWWLVSPELAGRLQAAGLPVLRFYELHLWGRSASGSPLTDDVDLRAALVTPPRGA
jgi:hypothetical protein